jgi:Penicillin binding protein transpeptidase domain/Penicillin-binding Protein dimerisation domain/NTF2-like N-terminal transpeptidase domain
MRHVVAICFALVLAGCTQGGGEPNPGPSADSANRAAAELAAGLAARDVSKVEFAGADSAQVNADLNRALAGLGGLKPAVQVGEVDVQGNTATASLEISWTFPGVPQQWAYRTSAKLVEDAGRWKSSWQPALVHPELTDGNALSQRRLAPDRGELLGEGGAPIVTLRPVVRIGLDKSRLSPRGGAGGSSPPRSNSAERVKTSALRLAKLVGISPSPFAAKVAAAGPKAYVEAIVFREGAADRPTDSQVAAIPGAIAIKDQQMLAPTRDFARPVIGTVGEATKEIVDASKGTVAAGDQVGLSGLQRRYDPQLRGTPGVQVLLIASKPAATASPEPTPSASPAAESKVLFEVKPVAGKALQITLQPKLQSLAERTLAKTKPASAIVAIRPSTGAILAAANGAGTNGQSAATVGQFAPGSTFKVVSSLGLLRAGLTPSSQVTCPSRLTVTGRTYRNYSDYPAGSLGRIDLRTALAQSCNTAFIGQRDKLGPDALMNAAASLGVGVDYDVGFPAFFGSVPPATSETGKAEAMIGQGKVQVSPLAMASVVASVAAGKSVLPYLVQDHKATTKAQPLTAPEAEQLRSMMRSVVTEGSGRVLLAQDGPPIIAKTGTAEYGTSRPLKTHVWMIAARGDLAVAVFVNDGVTGSRTAGPLLAKFLAGSR